MYRISSLFFLIICFSFHTAQAQVGQSPYTVQGIGSLNSMASTRNLGMGGVGIGNAHYLYLNNMNPAMLVRNGYYTTFEAGLSVEERRFSTLDEQDATTSGGLDYIAVAFPLVLNKWTLNLGLAPYSTVSYDMFTRRPIEGTTDGITNLQYTGSGGITQAYAATGFSLFKGLSAGIRASYMFGSISEQVSSIPFPEGSATATYIARYTTQTSFSDFLLTTGLGYRHELSSKRQRFIMAGLTYELEADLDANRISYTERVGDLNQGLPSNEPAGVDGSYSIPGSLGAGISYEKLYTYTFAADFKYQNWEDYRNFTGETDELGKSYRMAVGAEWTPDYSSAKAGTYYERMTYRMGLQYEKTPFVVDGEEINDFGINFGLSLPVSNASSIHTSLLLGQRGTIENNLIRERYFRLSLGVTFNDRWFTKVKYD